MSYRDRYPRKCRELCPRCKRECMVGAEEHKDMGGNPYTHMCGGGHWWQIVTGLDALRIEVSGNVVTRGHLQKYETVGTNVTRTIRKPKDKVT